MQAKTKRWIKRGVLCAAAVFVLGAGVTAYLLQRPPAAWRIAQQVLGQTTPEMREQIAVDVKRRLAELAQSKAPGFQRIDLYGRLNAPVDLATLSEQPLDQFAELTLTNEELIAIVNDFFVQWTQQRGYIVPGGVNDPVVIAQDGKLLIAFMIHTPLWQQVFSGEVALAFKPDGMAIGRVKNLYAGSFPISAMTVGDWLRLHTPKSEEHHAERMGDWLGKLERFEFRPVIELEHRRRARVVSMDVGDSGVTMRMRVQDHRTYRNHNNLLGLGEIAVTDRLDAGAGNGSKFADVPTTTD